MRRALAAISVFVLSLSSAGCAQDAAAPSAAAGRFKSTLVTANLEEPLVDGKNVVWCAAFQRADAPAFEKRIEFAVPFDPPDSRYEFDGVPVRGFGFDARSRDARNWRSRSFCTAAAGTRLSSSRQPLRMIA